MATDLPSTTDLTSLMAAINAMTQVIGSNGRSLSTLATEYGPAKYTHISTAGTVLVQASSCALFSLNINTGVAGATATVYDSASTATLPGSAVVAAFSIGTSAPINVPIGPVGRGLTLNNGLVIVTTGTADITFARL